VSASKVAGSLCSGVAVIYVLIMNIVVSRGGGEVARWRGCVAERLRVCLKRHM
jgi:hypothetical protein